MTMTKFTLYDYWRSSAAYRVRIALNLKHMAYHVVPTSLLDGAHLSADYKARNPQGFVPALDVGSATLAQSLAIIDWLDSEVAQPRLIPAEPLARAQVLAQALIIAADIHPVNNLRILKYLKNEMGQNQDAIDRWIRHWVAEGFAALEALAPAEGFFGGDAPNAVDVLLVPQMYNARRFHTDLAPFPKLVRIDGACAALPEFASAHPDAVNPDI
jgi:maleylacetoacetate isomerase